MAFGLLLFSTVEDLSVFSALFFSSMSCPTHDPVYSKPLVIDSLQTRLLKRFVLIKREGGGVKVLGENIAAISLGTLLIKIISEIFTKSQDVTYEKGQLINLA